MKIIFSRKGFDSSAGGIPSPIMPDGTMFSLPIPRPSRIAYQDLAVEGHSLGKVVEDLSKGRIRRSDTCHLDPDLREDMLPRMRGWRPVFGQRGAPARHLSRHGISPGDIFLFFGWFRRVEVEYGSYRYVPGAPHLHVLFGWLQVGEVYRQQDMPPPWARYHPHFQETSGLDNVVFISSQVLHLGRHSTGLPGAGFFRRYDQRLCLSAQGCARSYWSLPAWLYPAQGREALSFHGNRSRWSLQGDRVILRTAARGQEFVLDADQYPEVLPWITTLIRAAG
ncbi:MAG: hypothetical protein ONB30_04005 [candidate division KSB1 bacterium]|nr:hypothetical protein [candidate division KSB1 bacterium]